MKKIFTITLFCATLILISETANAQKSGFGLGAMINSPTGISYKAWINEDAAIAGGLTFNIGDFSIFYIHSDFLMHSKSDKGNIDLESGMLRVYYGGGVILTYSEFNDDVDFGARIPLGVTYQFDEVSADVFFEFVPTITFEDANFGFNGAVGFRYYLN